MKYTLFFFTPQIQSAFHKLDTVCTAFLVSGYGASWKKKATAVEWKGVSVKVWEWNKLFWERKKEQLLKHVVTFIDKPARWKLFFFLLLLLLVQSDSKPCHRTRGSHKFIHTNWLNCLFGQECTPQHAMAALGLLIAPIGKVTSAVTDPQTSYAECLNNMTTWYPTQMVAATRKRARWVNDTAHVLYWACNRGAGGLQMSTCPPKR